MCHQLTNTKYVILVPNPYPPNLLISKKLFETLNKSKNQFIVMGDLNAKSTLWISDINSLNESNQRYSLSLTICP